MGYGSPCCTTCVHKNENCYCGKNSACTLYRKDDKDIIKKVNSIILNVETGNGDNKTIIFNNLEEAGIDISTETKEKLRCSVFEERERTRTTDIHFKNGNMFVV